MHHVLSAIVEDKPGVLARVAAMFSNRGFNIHSLAVGPTEVHGRSHMTLVVDAPELEQLKKQLHKLVNVIKVQELDPADALESEVLLARVSCPPHQRATLSATASIFGARTVDVGRDSITFEVAGKPSHLSSFLEDVTPHGLVEVVKSGRIALRRVSEVTPVMSGGDR